MDKTQIDILVTELSRLNKLYRLGTPEISDAQYDTMVQQLKIADPENAWFTAIEPAPVSQSRKRKLPIPMKSLNKVRDIVELKAWSARLGLLPTTKVVVMPKYDGISWLRDEASGAVYSRGGAENEGQDCSAHYKVGDFGHNVGELPDFTYGELVFSVRDWEENFAGKVSPETGLLYKSPRNTVAGLVNRDVPSKLLQHASFVRYGVDEAGIDHWPNFAALLQNLDNIFNDDESRALWKVASLNDLSEDYLQSLFVEWRKYFYIDGLVIYLNDFDFWHMLGRMQTTGNPLYAIAYKHPEFTAAFQTEVKGIEWKVSKSGALKPVVQIEEVDTGDCIMKQPTGYNAGWCRDNNIGPGASIIVTRSGDVIPKIIQTVKPAACQLPRICPTCKSRTEFDPNGIELRCTNSECPGIQKAKIIHFLNVLSIENMGEETVSKIFDAGYRSVKAILDLTEDDLVKIEGFGDTTAEDIVSQMAKIKEGVSLPVLMHASDCFKGIGQVKAQKIIEGLTESEVEAFCHGYYFLEAPDTESKPYRSLPITKQNLHMGYFPFIDFVKETGIPCLIPLKADKVEGKCSGFNVCFTGIRDAALEGLVKSLGGNIASGVSKNTTHLVVKDVTTVSSKTTKAKQLGIPILPIEQFRKLVE